MEIRRLTMLVMVAAACNGSVVAADDSTGTTTSESTEGESTSDDETTSMTSLADESSSSGTSTPADVGVDVPPPGRSRLVLDVETDGGHGLMLYELVDGVPQPEVLLTAGASTSTQFRSTPLGAADRIALDVEYLAGTHDLFVVDWSAGHPATITQIDDAVPASGSIGPVEWVEELGAIVVRIADGYYRIDVSDGGAAEPVDLLPGLPFGIVLDDGDSRFVMPYGPVLVVRGRNTSTELYAADIADPGEPQQLTDFAGTLRAPAVPLQLASGHLVYQVRTIPGAREEPAEVHLVLRDGDAWSSPIAITPTLDLPATYLFGVRPHGDEFVYGAAMPEDPSGDRLLLGRIDDDVLAEPELLHEGPLGFLVFAADGSRLTYVDALDGAVYVVDFGDEGPEPERRIDPLVPAANLRVRAISADDAWLYAEIRDPVAYELEAVARIGLDRGAPTQIIAGEIAATTEIRDYVLTPDDHTLVFSATSTEGLVTRVVDIEGLEPGAPIAGDHGDGPILHEWLASPDSAWLLAATGHGGSQPDAVVVTRRDAPSDVVLEVADLVDDPLWLP